MFVGIVHYHLNRGGVTQVIANHLCALAAAQPSGPAARVVVLHGGRQFGWPATLPEASSLDWSQQTVAGLDYDGEQTCTASELAERLASAMRQAGATPEATVLHVHNHALGKNLALPGALVQLAESGFGLLLHVHDFAEDFRPANYRRSTSRAAATAAVYPQAARIHYAVLNRRDRRILQQAGADPSRLHVLPNPVGDPGPLPSRDGPRRKLAERFGLPTDRFVLLYPVRGIRRKNLGEALLWSAAAGDAWRVALTLPPLNPVEQPSYRRWRALAESLKLPIAFEIGAEGRLSFPESLAAADRMLTTSVAEGFGMVFLESWLANKLLVGRDLPEITADFVDAGLRYDHLQPRLRVPWTWIDAAEFHSELCGRYGETLRQYGREPPTDAELACAFDRLTAEGHVDFAALPTRHQERVVARVARDADARDELHTLNPWLAGALAESEASDEAVRRNAELVRREYALDVCGRRLWRLYRGVLDEPQPAAIGSLPHPERIVDEFLAFARFQPLRVEP